MKKILTSLGLVALLALPQVVSADEEVNTNTQEEIIIKKDDVNSAKEDINKDLKDVQKDVEEDTEASK